MQVGWGFTAARRRASRLAGLARLPVCWRVQTAIRRRASWLASKGQRGFDFTLAFGVAKKSGRTVTSPYKSRVCPTPTVPGQSGDRQRREKGPPILTAEKGEHERAPPLCVSYPAPLRATLRAPPSKWAIEAFFRRVSAANCPEGKRGPSGALGAAQSDPQGGWEASRATGRELCDTGHPVLEDSPEGATADRSLGREGACAQWAQLPKAVSD